MSHARNNIYQVIPRYYIILNGPQWDIMIVSCLYKNDLKIFLQNNFALS